MCTNLFCSDKIRHVQRSGITFIQRKIMNLANIANFEFQTSDFIALHLKQTGIELNWDSANEILSELCAPATLPSNIKNKVWYKRPPRPVPKRNFMGQHTSRK
jgi:hypothetical protein